MARGGGGGGGGGGRGRSRGRPSDQQSRETTISKAISFVLRHGAIKEGLKLDENGYANAADLLTWNRLSSLKVTFPELQSVVQSNEKQRFALVPISSPPQSSSTESSSFLADPENPAHHLIRANQGHSLHIASENLLTPILASDVDCPDHVVHGTNEANWKLILKTGGLRAMSRQHIHFALRAPDSVLPSAAVSISDPLIGTSNTSTPVISGMRATAQILIWVDVKRSFAGGLKWWKSANGVILTEGGANKLVQMEWVDRVERRGGELIWTAGKEIVESRAGHGKSKIF